MHVLLTLAIGACHHAPAPVAEATPPVIAETAPAPPAATAPCCRGLPLPSSWTSAACEGRDWERRIAFSEGRFEAQDLVAPCPPGKLCVWSGILTRVGSWTLDRRQVRLTETPAGNPAPQAGQFPFPDHLWLAEDGALTEDEGRCPYSRTD